MIAKTSFEKGMEKGLELAEEMGLGKGLEAARVKQCALAERLVRRRFGELPVTAAQRLRSYSLDQLETLIEGLMSASSLAEVGLGD